MKIFKDPLLLLFLGLLALSLVAFYKGLLPYPFGLLVLLVLIVGRIVYSN